MRGGIGWTRPVRDAIRNLIAGGYTIDDAVAIGVRFVREQGLPIHRGESRERRPISSNPDRDAKILALRREGLTYREIGKRFDLSHARVGQIVSMADRWDYDSGLTERRIRVRPAGSLIDDAGGADGAREVVRLAVAMRSFLLAAA